MYFKLGIFLLPLLGLVYGSKLNLPRVLLPIFQTLSTNFTLEVTGSGCYKWSSSRLDIVLVTPVDVNINRGCSQKAVVSCVSRETVRNMAIVLAEEVVTGQIFRADVIVDVISRLNIITTTRELYMEEPPEMFEVRAYDLEGNEFTTLEGVELLWSLGGRSAAQNVLRFMSFRESTYETPPSIALFDSLGKQGHIVLLEGVRTGVAKVSVQLAHSEYRSVPSVEVSLTVIANLIIDPPDAYIMPGDIINYRILQVKQGRLVEINLAKSQYILVPEDSSIADVGGDLVKGISFGRTKLLLQDSERSSERLPTAHVTVTDPDYITLSMAPKDSWSLFTGQAATIVTNVYDRENHRMTLGREARVTISVDASIFPISQRTPNGSLASGKAESSGSAEVTSNLYPAGSRLSDRPSPLHRATAVLHVYPPIELSPAVVVLPYHHLSRSELQMKATGGDGSYSWDIANQSVAVVSQSGKVTATGEGQTEVFVSVLGNPHLSARARVHSLVPTALEILEGVREGEVNSDIVLQVALFAHTKSGVKVPFSDCQQMRFRVEFDSAQWSHVASSELTISKACTVIGVIGKEEGRAKVTVFMPGTDLKAEATIAAFRPLSVLHPSSGSPVVLAVGSSRHIVVTGGPKSWFGRLVVSHSSGASIFRPSTLVDRQQFYVFNVICTDYGTRTLEVSVVTEPYVQNCKSVRSLAKVDVICAHPKHVELSVAMGPDCPLSGTDQAIATCLSKFRLNMAVKDAQGRVFDNATSLAFKWISGKEPLVLVEDEDSIDLSTSVQADYTLPEEHFKEVMTRAHPGSGVIRTRITGYRSSVLSPLSISMPSLETKPEGALLLKVVEPVVSDPTSVSVVNQAMSKTSVTLLHGSGYFRVVPQPEHAVDAEYDSTARKVNILPKADGALNLVIYDLCLPSTTLHIPTQVVNVGSVRVEVSSKIEKSRQVIATVRLYDSTDRLIHSAGYGAQLTAADPGFVSISPESDGTFTITGIAVGRTVLIATWNNLTSQPAPIQVYGAIRLNPRNVTLLVGSEFQVKVVGGPGPDLVYAVGDSSIATVSPSGLITASHLGETYVTASAGGEGASRDTIGVTVIPLTGVTIASPVTVIAAGRIAPVWAAPIPSSLSPAVLGSVHGVQFVWTVSSSGVLALSDRLADLNINVKNEDRLSMVMKALRPGRTTIHLGVSGVGHLVRTSLEIEVVEPLSWIQPPAPSNHILLAPGVTIDLSATKEDAEFHVMSSSGGASPVQEQRGLSAGGPAVTLSGSSLTTHHSGHALLLATSASANAQSPAFLSLQVKPVHFIMARPALQLNSSIPLTALPLGFELSLAVNYFDLLGSTFYASPSSLHSSLPSAHLHRASVGGTNNTISISLDSLGSSVLHVYDPISSVAHDYIKLPVEHHIIPYRSVMAVGEIVCFTSRAGWASGTWSGEGSVLVDPSGAVKAIRPGQATIHFSVPSPPLSSALSIQVLSLHQVAFSKSSQIIVTNAVLDAEYIIPVELLTEKGRQSGPSSCPDSAPTPLAAPPFTCEIRYNSLSVAQSIYSVFSIEPIFDKSIGSYACSLRVIAGPSMNTSVINSNVTVRVQAGSSYGERMPAERSIAVGDSVLVVFYPGISLTSHRIHLKSPSAKAYLNVVATPFVASHLLVESSDSTVLTIGPKELRSHIMQSWPIAIAWDAWSQQDRLRDLYISITSPTTNQRIKVPVITSSTLTQPGCIYVSEEDEWSSYTPSAHYSILIAIIAIVIFFFASNYCYIQWNRPSSSSPRSFGHEYAHSTLQEAAFGRRSNPSPLSSTRPVYGSPGSSPLNTSSPRMRKLYPSD